MQTERRKTTRGADGRPRSMGWQVSRVQFTSRLIIYRLVTLQNFPSLCILYRDIEWEMPPNPPPITLGPELGWCLGMIGTFKRWIFVGESTSLGVPFCIYSLIPLSRLLPDSSLCIISTVKGVICWLSQFLAPAAGCHATPPWQTCPLEP